MNGRYNGAFLIGVHGTQRHDVIGTTAYMSPEQAEGKAVDHRSDIFPVGILLYEMATGTRPFKGESAISILSSIIKDVPAAASAINPRVPPELERICRPNGKWVVCGGENSGNLDIYLQSVSGSNPVNLTQDSAADDDMPAFSPDGEHIVFRSAREDGGSS